MTPSPVFCAVDTTDLRAAETLARILKGRVGGLKLGLEFFTFAGPAGVARVAEQGLPLFLDLKFHDIPNTVAGAVRAAMALAPAIMTVHAAGGPAMLKAAADTAAEEAARRGLPRPKVVAVTVLTSLDQSDLDAVGLIGPVEDRVRRLAALAQDSGLAGVVCSPKEVAALRAQCGPDFHLVVPGIRPAGAAIGDQKRVMSPREAVQAGADTLVIGRPITGAANPAQAAQAIADELAGAR